MTNKHGHLTRHGMLVLPKQTLRAMGIGRGDKVRIRYNPHFRELIIKPLKKITPKT